jgi:hypothetical protein
MRKTHARSILTLILPVVAAGSTSPAFAAEPAAPEPPKVTEERLAAEGKKERREGYFADRRKSLDPTLDTAAARAAAASAVSRSASSLLGSPYAPIAWQPYGPAPINGGQTPTSTPRIPSDVTGRVTSIAIDPVNDAVYIGAAQGGVWRTTDDGATWTPLSDTLASTAIGSVEVDPPGTVGDPAIVYVGTGEGNGSCDSYGGVGFYRSTDSGATWSGPFGAAEFGNRSINDVVIDSADPTHLIAVSGSGIFGVGCTAAPTLPDRGVFESHDSGSTWAKRTTGNHRFSNLIQDPQTPTRWWAAGFTSGASVDPANEGGLKVSNDNGDSWTQVAGTGGLPALATTWGRAWITGTTDPDFPGQSVLYLANSQTEPGFGQGKIFKSTDSGTTWTEVTGTGARGFCNAQCFYDMPIYVEPGNEQVFYTGGAGTSTAGAVPSQFMRSDNGGTTFADKVRSGDSATALHADVHAITSWPGAPAEIWTGNDGGVWRSLDRGNNWINANGNLQITQFSGCDLHPTDRNVVYAGSQDNGTEGRESANNWKHLDFGDGGFARIDQSDPDNLVHTYFNQTNNLIGVGFTTAGFATTMGSYLGSFAPGNGIALSDRVLFYAPIHLDRGTHSTLYYGTHRLWRATNFFANPNSFVGLDLSQDLTGGTGAVSAIETFANPGGGDAQLIYTGASSGVVFRSVNGGSNWTQVDVGGSALFVSDILVDPTDSNVVWQSRAGFAASAGLNVRRSSDGGASWNPAGTGIPNIPVNALAFDPAVSGRIWAGTDVGAFYSDDDGTSWTAFNVGLPTTAIFDLDSQRTTDTLVACTHGRGVFVLDGGVLFADDFESGNTVAWDVTF